MLDMLYGSYYTRGRGIVCYFGVREICNRNQDTVKLD